MRQICQIYQISNMPCLAFNIFDRARGLVFCSCFLVSVITLMGSIAPLVFTLPCCQSYAFALFVWSNISVCVMFVVVWPYVCICCSFLIFRILVLPYFCSVLLFRLLLLLLLLLLPFLFSSSSPFSLSSFSDHVSNHLHIPMF